MNIFMYLYLNNLICNIVVHACNLSNTEAEAREFQVPGQPGLHIKLKVSLDCAEIAWFNQSINEIK